MNQSVWWSGDWRKEHLRASEKGLLYKFRDLVIMSYRYVQITDLKISVRLRIAHEVLPILYDRIHHSIIFGKVNFFH